jgi:hypothetical protein
VKGSKSEDERYNELLLHEKSGKINSLKRWPVFLLYSKSGKLVHKYTCDFEYRLKDGTLIAEEFKGSVHSWSYKRSDYKIKLKHAIADYPEYKFIENIAGKLREPKVRWPKES